VDTPPLLVEPTAINALSATALIHSNTTETWPGAAKVTTNLTRPEPKQKMANLVHMNSSVPTVKEITKQMTPSAHSGNIGSTENGIQRNRKSSEKSEPTQFARLQVVLKYDY